MKKSLLLFVFVATYSFIIAQPTLTSTNYVPAVNDNQLYYIADTNSVIDPTIGANVVFSYGGLSGYGMTQNQYIVNPASTTNGSSFPTATYADTSDATASNIRYAQTYGTDSLNNIGFVAQIPGYGTVIAQYDTDEETLMKFPFNYGDNYVDPYAGTFTMQGQNFNGQGNATVTADAWGELQMPLGVTIDSVLRVKTVEYVITDTIVITFPPITLNPFEINATYINYYKPSISKFPLLSYVTGSIKQDGNVVDSTNNFISQYPLLNVGVEEINKNLTAFNLFPNPSNNQMVTVDLTVEDNSLLKIDLLNKLGQKVKTIFNGQSSLGRNKFEIDTNNLSAGIYFVNITIDGNSVAKKLVLQ